MKRHPPPGATKRARSLRKNMTDAKRVMWYLLKEFFPDWHWRKQVPIRQYYADFASHKAKLVIEVDGGQHNETVDAERTVAIEGDGYKVIRFWNNDVLSNREGVAEMIGIALADRSPPPSCD